MEGCGGGGGGVWWWWGWWWWGCRCRCRCRGVEGGEAYRILQETFINQQLLGFSQTVLQVALDSLHQHTVTNAAAVALECILLGTAHC